MNLRPYQLAAVAGIAKEFKENPSTLLVLPTGTGKTVVFAHAINNWTAGRVLVLAHREELIRQAADKIERITGEQCEVEMAAERADLHMFRRAKVVVSSVQTMIAGKEKKRMEKFNPLDFGLIVTDEAHHCPAPSYRRIYDYFFAGNPAIKHLGVTATPDRTDEAALGRVFGSVAFVYEITDAIRDGWLAPIKQRSIRVESLDYSQVRVTAGDLNQADIAKAQQDEKTLHELCLPIIKEARWRKTIVFATPGSLTTDDGDPLHIAERMTEIINRYRTGQARRISQATPTDERRQILRDYEAGKFQFLVNVGVLTEGFDSPGIEVVAVTRPTKSRALYAQMIGRGTRPLPGLVDSLDTADGRRAAIARSKKPYLEVLDFVGNAGRHKLVTVADVLGGNYDEVVVERAKKIALKEQDETGQAVGAMEKLAEAEEQIEREKAEEKQRRQEVLAAKAQYQSEDIDPFNILDIRPERERDWDTVVRASEKQIDMLRSNKVPIPEGGISRKRASQLIAEIIRRRQEGLCTYGQARQLAKRGLDPNVSFQEARRLMDEIATREGWSKRKQVTG